MKEIRCVIRQDSGGDPVALFPDTLWNPSFGVHFSKGIKGDELKGLQAATFAEFTSPATPGQVASMVKRLGEKGIKAVVISRVPASSASIRAKKLKELDKYCW